MAATFDAYAENGRDFSAMYDFFEVTAVDTAHVSLTLVLQLQNHSGGYVANGTLALVDRLRPDRKPSTFADTVTVADRRGVKVSGTLTIDTREYQDWQRGVPPALVIDFIDARGRKVERVVELARLPGVRAPP
jgi:hypothetical protein